MTVALTIIVPTLGRASLADTIVTINEQAGENDEIMVIAARAAWEPDVRAAIPRQSKASWRLFLCDQPSNHGDAERNMVIPQANGTHLAFLDDDDIYLPGALDAMRERAADVPVIFRMIHPAFETLWADPELRFGNVSTQMFMVPNQPGKLGEWGPYYRTEGTDFSFISGTCRLQGEPLWDKRVISQARPTATRWV